MNALLGALPRRILLVFILSSATSRAGDRPTPPAFRLPDTASPVSYDVELTLDPTAEVFSGRVEIEITLKEETALLWLNGTDLSVESASLEAHGKTLKVSAVPGGSDFVGFGFEPPAPAGRVRLKIVYTGHVSDKGDRGLLRERDGDDWYMYSDFEPTSARRAFPCFDEPGWKVPWHLTLRVNASQVAVANTSVTSETIGPGGSKRVTFATTKPLPSYLVAFGVGPFEVVPAGGAGRNKTPVRIIVPKGRSGEARWAAESAGAILEQLERYFDSPFPYEKLDHLVMPKGMGGAMENAGLVTYGASVVLKRTEDESIRSRRSYATLCAHETAHQWLGDMVTMAWWDDLWLNEAFATWLADKILDRWKPEWRVRVDNTGQRSSAVDQDALTTARRVRQPVGSKDDIENAFDAITYFKGAAVLEGFEAWLGEEPFRKAVQRYLRAHAWGNATAADFLRALAAETKNPAVPAAFSTFLDQPGIPLVVVELVCANGTRPMLHLTQKRFLPAGSTGAAVGAWKVPVCATVENSGSRSCILLAEPSGNLALPGGGCPQRVLANAGMSGYYLTAYGGRLLQNLLADGGKGLGVVERIRILGDVGDLVRSGDVPAATALSLVPLFARDPDRGVVQAAARLAQTPLYIVTSPSAGAMRSSSGTRLARGPARAASARSPERTTKRGSCEDRSSRPPA